MKKKIGLALVIVLLLSLAFATAALAATPPACDSGHGAFTYFSNPDNLFTPGYPPYFGDSILGSARGGLTGANNANYSAYCNGN